MDFVEGLPKSEGFTVIMVVVDRLSKSAHFVALKHPFTAASVATVFIREIVRLHGIPRSIVSDRDKVFVSHFWREIFRYQGTELKRSTAYHPQTDGQTEVVNRSLETYLRCFTSARPKEWVRWLPWAEYWHNTSYHSRIRMSPFKVLYGRDPPTLVRYDHGSAVTFEVDRYLQERDRVLEELRGHLLKAQQAMKEYEDSKRREVNFDVGDFVYLKFRPYRQTSVTPRLSEKLAPRFYGPFEVLERVGKVAYRLKLPPSSTLHPVFHVSQLKRSVGQQVPIGEITEIPEEPISEPLQPETVHDVRQNEGVREVLIKWKGLPESESTWEPFEMISRQFPLFHLEDKVDVLEGGNAVIGDKGGAHWGQVYNRRPKAS